MGMVGQEHTCTDKHKKSFAHVHIPQFSEFDWSWRPRQVCVQMRAFHMRHTQVYTCAGQVKGSIQSTSHAWTWSTAVERGALMLQTWNGTTWQLQKKVAWCPNLQLEPKTGLITRQKRNEHLNIWKVGDMYQLCLLYAHSILSMEIWDVIQIYLRSTCVPTLKKQTKNNISYQA